MDIAVAAVHVKHQAIQKIAEYTLFERVETPGSLNLVEQIRDSGPRDSNIP